MRSLQTVGTLPPRAEAEASDRSRSFRVFIVAITLVCDACLKTEQCAARKRTRLLSLLTSGLLLRTSPEKCRHKMSEVPRWISSQKVETVRSLLAEDPVRATLWLKTHPVLLLTLFTL